MTDQSAPTIPQRHYYPVWEVGPHNGRKVEPDQWVSAEVPGAVQLDWGRAHDWPDYWRAENYRTYDGLEDRFWTYRTHLPSPRDSQGHNLYFVCKGVDYRCEVSLNDQVVHEHEGMFTPFEIPIPPSAKGELRLTIFPAPKSRPEPHDRSQADHSCKPAMSYGWDFHPRLIPLGIWEDTYFEHRPNTCFREVDLSYDLGKNFDIVEIRLRGQTTGDYDHLLWSIRSPEGAIVASKKIENSGKGPVEDRISVQNPELWWPHDHGNPALYTTRLELVDKAGATLDVKERRMGFRQIRLTMAPDQWKYPAVFPKSRSHPPMTLEINGRPIFAKGANWVSPEIFPGLLKRETYAEQLSLVRDSHMNLLRMWGGAPAQKESFYDLCDELGIMVWQEFPLACNNYPDEADYLRVLDQESGSLIGRLRLHPAVVIWCAGNELFNSWSRMTDQSLAIRLLNSQCFQLDPTRPFLPTSPVGGVGHGHYVFYDPTTGVEAWKLFQQSHNTAYCEFGCPGPASVEVIREIIPESEQFPPKPKGSWEAHHAFNAWMPSSHLYIDVLEDYFGACASLDELVERGQLLQSEGYRGLYEEARRQKPNASMALCWSLNEPWPTAANLSLISWPCRPKPSLSAVAAACRPVLASARIRKMQWNEGEVFDPEIGWLYDRYEVLDPGMIEVRVETETQKWTLLNWNSGQLSANTNLPGPALRWALPDLQSDRFNLVLDTPDHPEFASRYTLLFRARSHSEHASTRIMNLD